MRPRDSRVLGGSARPGLRDSPMSQLHRQGLHPPVAEASRVLRDVSLSPNDPLGIILRHLPGDSDDPPGAGRLRRLALPEPPFCSVCCKFLSPASWPQPGQVDLSAQQRPDSDSRTRDVHRPQTTSGHPPGPGVGGWPTVDRGTTLQAFISSKHRERGKRVTNPATLSVWRWAWNGGTRNLEV